MSSSMEYSKASDARGISVEGKGNIAGEGVQVTNVGVPVHVHVYAGASTGSSLLAMEHMVAAPEPIPLTPSERELVLAYRSSPFEAQATIQRAVRRAIKRVTLQKLGCRKQFA